MERDIWKHLKAGSKWLLHSLFPHLVGILEQEGTTQKWFCWLFQWCMDKPVTPGESVSLPWKLEFVFSFSQAPSPQLLSNKHGMRWLAGNWQYHFSGFYENGLLWWATSTHLKGGGSCNQVVLSGLEVAQIKLQCSTHWQETQILASRQEIGDEAGPDPHSQAA